MNEKQESGKARKKGFGRPSSTLRQGCLDWMLARFLYLFSLMSYSSLFTLSRCTFSCIFLLVLFLDSRTIFMKFPSLLLY
jgi:hypothetical protein